MQARAQSAAAGVNRPTLRAVFDAAWAQQPEARSLATRRDAARAQHQAASSLTPEPLAMELSTKTDRLIKNGGGREYEVGLAIPLWLPGERVRSQSLADAEGRAIESRAAAAQLRLAATVRDTWWAWQRARVELDVVRGQLDNVRHLAADVSKRLAAGDLARADQHQADGAVAAAEAAVAQATGAVSSAWQQLLALGLAQDTDLPADSAGSADLELEPEPSVTPASAKAEEAHADLLALKDRAEVADRISALAAAQSRASPELTVAATRDRGSSGESYQQTLRLGVRFPFGAGPRHDARLASARAEALELQAQIAVESARLAGGREAARARTEAVRVQLAAAERRAQLARDTRGFFDKSFRLGESDLPTRMRIEAEAADAERQVMRMRIERAAAISSWRQALGLLPQ